MQTSGVAGHGCSNYKSGHPRRDFKHHDSRSGDGYYDGSMSRDALPPSPPPSRSLRVLIVEDNPADADLIRYALKPSPDTEVRHVECLADAIDAVRRGEANVVLLDLSLPDAIGLEGVGRLHAVAAHVPIVVVTGQTDEALAVSAVRQGADDYLFKGDLQPAMLRRILRYAVERREFVRREAMLVVEQAAREEAEAVNRMKDEFLATLSHELRTPLNAIVGWTEVLRRRFAGSPEDRNALAAIARNASALTRLITDLLDVSRIAAGQILMDSRDVDPIAVVRAAVDSLTPTARAKGVPLDVVTESAGGVLVTADPARLLQVVSNLVSNALKFTPPSGEVRISIRRVDAGVAIAVEDTGIGFPPEAAPYLFDRFWQADGSAQRHHGGLGLGLAIVKQLTQLQGGTVEARSAGEGKGAVFTLTFPAVARPGLARAKGADEAPPDLSDVRVLVVEDDADSRELMRVVLEERGARVLTAASAKEAVAIVEDGRPDALLVDLGLPDEDGYALLRRIRELPVAGAAEIPAAAVTAFASAEDERRVFRAGFPGYLVNPVTPGEALALVASLVGSPLSCAGRTRPS